MARYPKKRCRYCKGLFDPIQPTQDFCKPEHRKAFWKHGALPFDKLLVRIDKETRRIVREEFAALEARLRNTLAETRANAG